MSTSHAFGPVYLVIDGEVASRLADVDTAEYIASVQARAGHDAKVVSCDSGAVLWHGYRVDGAVERAERPTV